MKFMEQRQSLIMLLCILGEPALVSRMQNNNTNLDFNYSGEIHWKQFWIPTVLVSGLVILSYYHYLAFHVLAEFFTVGVAITMFVVIWHTYDFSKNHFLMYLAAGYLWLGGLDVIHTLLYYGMPTAMDKGNFTSQFWIGTRFLESVLLLTSTLFISKSLNRKFVVALFGIISGGLAAAILLGLFPDTFIDGSGLTRFKVFSEYLIITILLFAMIQIRRHRYQFDCSIYKLILICIGLTIGAELAFTFYVDMYGLSNLAGHIFKIYSFWVIYIAIIRTSLVAPFRILNHDLQELYERNQEAQRLAKLGHWSLDLINDRLTWSDEIFRIFEIDKKTFPASYEAFIAAIHPDDREKVNVAFQKSLDEKNYYEVEHRLLLQDGRVKYVIEQGRSIYNDAGEPINSIGTVLDITERKIIENELVKNRQELVIANQSLESEIEKRTIELRQAKDAAEKASEVKTQFLANMSHELRTPMNAIVGYNSLLSKTELSDKQKDFVNKAKKASKLLLELIQDILDYSQIDQGSFSADSAKFNLVKKLDPVIANFAELAREKDIQFSVDFEEEIPTELIGDPDHLNRVISKVTDNAIKFTGPGGFVGISIGKEHETEKQIMLRIIIKDSGIGIKKDHLDTLFEIFTQADGSSTREYGGTGMGLPIVKEIIDAMHGTIRVESAHSTGTSVHITLPFEKEQTPGMDVDHK
jgi:signal transduction histidine kinase